MIFVMVCANVESMIKKSKKCLHEIEMEGNEKLKAKRSLQKDIERIRLIKKCRAEKRAKKYLLYMKILSEL